MRFKKKKVRRQRASTFHGWGRGAAHHKGAGNRGGRGRSGSGKKADQKKPSYWTERVGKHGFSSKNRLDYKSINVQDIEANIESWVAKGFATKKGSGYQVELRKAGFGKVLGTGALKVALFINADFASKGAIEKVKAAGGEIAGLKQKKHKKHKVHKKKAEAEE